MFLRALCERSWLRETINRIEYPFRPNSPDWVTLWSQLRRNPNVVSIRGVGEVMSDRKRKVAIVMATTQKNVLLPLKTRRYKDLSLVTIL